LPMDAPVVFRLRKKYQGLSRSLDQDQGFATGPTCTSAD
jgi:hypothetical protein